MEAKVSVISIKLYSYSTFKDNRRTLFLVYSLLVNTWKNWQEARNIEDFLENFKDDPTVKIPRVYKKLSGARVLAMEWIDGIRCTDPQVSNFLVYL